MQFAVDLFGAAEEEFDATGLHVLPGVIDTQVHFREPGSEHKENLEAGSCGAVLGGVTTVFEMPNTNPPTSNTATLGPFGFFNKVPASLAKE